MRGSKIFRAASSRPYGPSSRVLFRASVRLVLNKSCGLLRKKREENTWFICSKKEEARGPMQWGSSCSLSRYYLVSSSRFFSLSASVSRSLVSHSLFSSFSLLAFYILLVRCCSSFYKPVPSLFPGITLYFRALYNFSFASLTFFYRCWMYAWERTDNFDFFESV